ncbi:hypothetical protein GUITHDRAFT_142869 [Guillardia theta CCMP2712]|uniref:E3 ubiquitin-protein ligase n=1 Tax=Guillardia theta (strain CCMP2712) TaxID=905079 RepID=L1IVX2_GUITC|nr:hypothetical protein GUITHDRAFT_142869 [Guillardia theta CCMP2712]EKX40376.1 hypothetical protein GUITHDRAFT_142869 [Guillardia theta CCMP2712]|eukprot:XP_005827356.1 hypothetical protein GUITHDRAFT_142869 [Guillardia theta CCMP2712]
MEEVGGANHPWSVLCLSREEFVSRIAEARSSPDHSMLERIITALKQQDDDMTPATCVELIGWLLAGEEPSPWLSSLKETGFSSKCGHVFESEEWIYKCLQCCADPTCCFCSKCFENSPCRKLGHRTQLARSPGGGCCDCGDPEAWNPSSFCSIHQAKSEETCKEDRVPQQLLRFAPLLFNHVLEYCCDGLLCNEDAEYDGDGFLAVLHNDDIHDMDTVRNSIVRAIDCDRQIAHNIMMSAHQHGSAIVKQGSKQHCNKIVSSLRKAGLIVTLTHRLWQRFELRATAILQYLADICSCSNSLRSVLCETLILRDTNENLHGVSWKHKPLQVFMENEESFWAGASPVLHNLYVQLIADEKFKNFFADAFIKLYPSLIDSKKESSVIGNITLLDVSVQVFTVPSVVQRLVRERRLMSILLSSLWSSLADEIIDVNHYDRDAKELPNGYRRVLSDLVYVLRIPQISLSLIQDEGASDANTIESFFRFLESMQEMDKHPLQKVEHVRDDRNWSESFSLATEICQLQGLIVQGYRQSLAGISVPAGSDGQELSAFLSSAPFTVMKRLYSTLLDWAMLRMSQNAVKVGRTRPADGSHGYPYVDYEINKHSVSLHCPLHRMFSSLWAEVMQWSKGRIDMGRLHQQLVAEVWKESTLSDASSYCEGVSNVELFNLMLLELPLRVFILSGQSMAGVWLRNGMFIRGQLQLWCSSRFGDDFLRLDLYNLQFTATMLSPANFLSIFAERFMFKYWMSPLSHRVGLDDEQYVHVLAEMLYTLIMVLCDRGFSGNFDERGEVRRLLIHRLAVEATTHSNIKKNLPTSISSSDHFDSVLQEIATFRPANSTNPGTYCLKSNLWEEVDPFCWLYSRKEHEHVLETMESKFGLDSQQQKEKENASHLFTKFPPLPQALKELEHLLFSEDLWFMVSKIVNCALLHMNDEGAESHAFVNDSVLHRTLYICKLAVNHVVEEAKRSEGSGREEWGKLERLFTNDYQSKSVLVCLSRLLTGMQSQASDSMTLRFQPKRHEADIRHILQRLFANSQTCVAHASDAQALPREFRQAAAAADQPTSESAPVEESETSEVDEKARRKKEALERAMKEMQARQQAFAAMMQDDDEDDLDESYGGANEYEGRAVQDMYESVLPTQCVLCHEEASPGRPVGLISFVQASTVLSTLSKSSRRIEGTPSVEDESMTEDTSAAPPNRKDHPWSFTHVSQRGWEQRGRECGVATTFCGHAIHRDCLNRYQSSMTGLSRGRGSSSPAEFSCPLCRALGNNLVPLVPKDLLCKQGSRQAGQAMEEEQGQQQEQEADARTEEDEGGQRIDEREDASDYLMRSVDKLFQPRGRLVDHKKSKLQKVSQEEGAKIGGAAVLAEQAASYQPEKEMAEVMAKKIVETHLFAHEEGKEEFEAPTSPTLTAISSCIYSIFSMESACRLDGPPPNSSCEEPDGSWGSLSSFTATKIAPFTALVRAVRLLQQSKLSLDGESMRHLTMWSKLLRGIGAEEAAAASQPGNGDLHIKCVLEADVCSLLVHWLFLSSSSKSDTELSGEFDGFLRIFWVAQVMQAVLALSDGSAAGRAATGDEEEEKDRIGEDRENFSQLLFLMDSVLGAGLSDVSTRLPLNRVLEASLPFLRRCCLVKSLFFALPLPSYEQTSKQEEALILVHFLGLTGQGGIPSMEGTMEVLVKRWCEAFAERHQGSSRFSFLSKMYRRRAARPSFIDLPRDFQELFQIVLKQPCRTCGMKPTEPALCFMCGAIVCAGGDCCKKEGRGECTLHTEQCGAGINVFLIIKTCTFLVIRSGIAHGAGAMLPSPYLDEHGEEDFYLRRGEPLFLSQERILGLLKMWVSHQFNYELTRSGARNEGIWSWSAL